MNLSKRRKAAAPGEGEPVLLIALVVLALSSLGFALIAKVALVATRRLGLDLWTVAVWFGVAEAPRDDLAARRAAPAKIRPLRVAR